VCAAYYLINYNKLLTEKSSIPRRMRSPCRPKKNVLENLGYVHTEKKKRNQKDNVERYREMTKINELIILAPPLEECYPLPEHLLPFLQSIFIRQVLLLFGRETLAKV